MDNQLVSRNSEERDHDVRLGKSLVDNKKLRNRLSQQAFRKRQNAYIQDLERQLGNIGKSDNSRIQELEAENRMLHARILDFHNKLESIQASLSVLSVSTADILQLPTKKRSEHDTVRSTALNQASDSGSIHCNRDDQEPPDHIEGLSIPFAEQADINWETHFAANPTSELSNPFSISLPEINTYDINTYSNVSLSNSLVCDLVNNRPMNTALRSSDLPEQAEHQLWAGNLNSSLRSIPQLNDPLEGVPGVWSYNYQMGPAAYQAALDSFTNATVPEKIRFKITNSGFSDHLSSIRGAVAQRWPRMQALVNAEVGRQRLYTAISVMIALFNSISRRSVLSWYTPTNFYQYATNLTVYHLQPTRDNYLRLQPMYRPTALQMSQQYPTVIDWCPFASVRDRMILFHAANPFIDNIMSDVASSYVVETNVAELVKTDQPARGYVRVLDLTEAIKKGDDVDSPEQNLSFNGQSPQIDPMLGFQPQDNSTSSTSNLYTLPAPSIEALFGTPGYAKEAFKALKVVELGIGHFKLDPAFFVKHPELYDADANIVGTGQRIAPQTQTRFQGPTPLDIDTWRTYNLFARWSTNIICDVHT